MHSTQRITAQDFFDFDKCPNRVYLNRFGDPKEKLPHSDFLNMLFENALTHEHDVIRDLPYETPTGSSLEERAASTLELMRAGVERIYQGVFLQAGESGIPDLLERVDGHSKLGKYFYRPVDIKAGSGYDNPEKGTGCGGDLQGADGRSFPYRQAERGRPGTGVRAEEDRSIRRAQILSGKCGGSTVHRLVPKISGRSEQSGRAGDFVEIQRRGLFGDGSGRGVAEAA